MPSQSESTKAPLKETHASSSTLPPPRLDYKSISDNIASKTLNAINRRAALPSEAINATVRLYKEFKEMSSELDGKLALQNVASHAVQTATEEQTKLEAIRKAKSLKAEISQLRSRVAAAKTELLHTALPIPNDTHPDSPVGPEAAAKVLSTHGPKLLPTSPLRDHVRITHALQWLDLEAGSTVTGSSWYFLLNEGALLEMALINYALSVAIKHGYRPVITPDVVKADIAERCGFQPRDPENNVEQMYHLLTSGPKLVLSGTAEIALGGCFSNKIFEESQLPQRVVGIGKAFRAEAGARGADTRGLYRVHQFSKIELFAVTPQSHSDEALESMRRVQMDILNGLNLPFRVLEMPTEELGASAYRKYDIEAWMPGRGQWGEVTSASNCTDYQSRRLHIRYRRRPSTSTAGITTNEKESLPFAHTLNGTAAAIPRLIVALLENGVQLEGDDVSHINLPCILRPFWVGVPPGGDATVRWV
ncbi:seryl-tRNA synthetase [Hysterangium stoloniferum]|nr:seryl-tRNA synthetase [Hysterangium stoloniferum]